MPDLSRNSRPIVGNANANPSLGERLGGYIDAPVTPGEGINRVLGEGLQRPLEENSVALDDEIALMRRAHGHTLRKCRDAGAEIGGDVIDELTEIHGFVSRRTADALESVSNSLQPLEVRNNSIHPLMLESGVPSWCADSRAIPAHICSRSARPRVLNA
jgi:hypothetical protein